jgi:hypothetical protein
VERKWRLGFFTSYRDEPGKTLGEITEPAATLPGVEALLKKLGQLQAGEVVTLMPLPGVNDPAIIPVELLDQIQTTCREISLTCQFPIH